MTAPKHKVLPTAVHNASNTAHTFGVSRMLTAMALSAAMVVSGCQQPADNDASTNAKDPTASTEQADALKPATPSDAAQAQIDAFAPLYVERMLNLQQRLQAEYESLEAADSTEPTLDVDTTTNAAPSPQADADVTGADTTSSDTSNTDATSTNTNSTTSTAANNPTTEDNPEAAPQNDATVAANTSAEDTSASSSTDASDNSVSSNDLSVDPTTEKVASDILKHTVLEPYQPKALSAETLESRYHAAMEALYTGADNPLSADDVDTLINLGTLLPEVYEQRELAERLQAKSPALARLLIQHQVWRQIEAQQAADIAELKLAQLQAQERQQEEFTQLMTEFNQTIAGYDEQIAKYQQMLQDFE